MIFMCGIFVVRVPNAKVLKSVQDRVRRFQDDQSGALLVFALILFTLMAMMGGVALDLMRYETTRVTLQNTLDRSTLAAAAMTQTLDPETVVRDYFAKAGLSDELDSVTVTQAANSRKVRALGVADAKPYFLHMIGIDEFYAKGVATAEQGTSNVEIVLVLDVSGSMSGTKIASLKTAASEFVGTMLASDPFHRVSISIVPYNAQVNLGSVLRSKYQAVNQHGVANVNCIELPASVFGTATMSRTFDMPMMAYADSAYGTSQVNAPVSPTSGNALPNYGSAYCKPTTVNVVRLPSNDVTTLQAQINGLQAGGNTSITLGMKWGMTLLDPGSRGMVSELIASGNIGTAMEGRPFEYNDHQSMKVIVLMTDGEHVSHARITDPYKTGISPIFKSTGDGNYSVYFADHAGTNKYWVPHLSQWRADKWNSGAGAVQQDWKNIWANLRLSYVAWQFYGRALGGSNNAAVTANYNATMTAMRATYASVPAMDASLQDSCNLARQNGVIVYGIAFEAPANGQQQISACSTTAEGHYFNATDEAKIQTAFRTISSNLTQLRLTQ